MLVCFLMHSAFMGEFSEKHQDLSELEDRKGGRIRNVLGFFLLLVIYFQISTSSVRGLSSSSGFSRSFFRSLTVRE